MCKHASNDWHGLKYASNWPLNQQTGEANRGARGIGKAEQQQEKASDKKKYNANRFL
jgi:hypothetical protein